MNNFEQNQLTKNLQARANIEAKRLPIPGHFDFKFLASKYGCTVEYVAELSQHIKPNRYIFGDDS